MAKECAVCHSDENIHEHHIDGDNSNNSDENRIYLCAKHHREVHGDSRLPKLKDDLVLELREKLPDNPPVEAECTHCGYSWETKSVNEKATCPSCLRKTEVGK